MKRRRKPQENIEHSTSKDFNWPGAGYSMLDVGRSMFNVYHQKFAGPDTGEMIKVIGA
jgi:hypothetical protein